MFAFHQEDIQTLEKYLHPFPRMEDIFVPEQPWLKAHFLPLISIDLSVLNPEWQGQTVHMINPFEPYEGLIGEDTEAHHNEFTATNWLAFRLREDNRYEFLGNEGFFMRSPVNGYGGEMEEYVEEIRDYHQENREYFDKHGILVNSRWLKDGEEPNRQNFLDELGVGFWYGNWPETAEIPKAFTLTLPPTNMKLADLDELPDNGIKIAYNGNPFHYIAGVAGYNYCNFGADMILLMYEPVSRIVLFTFDYS